MDNTQEVLMRTDKDRQAYSRWYEKHKIETRARKTELMRKYRAENPEKYRVQSREAKARLKDKLFDMYGRSCALCGFDDIRALTLDHINGNGNTERKELGERGVYRRAAETYRPDEYRTLCMNCQFVERQK
jgi:predicted secreted protein